MSCKASISIVVPVFNEQDTVPLFISEINPILDNLDCDHEIIFVNDGSRDGTLQLLLRIAERNKRIKIIDLSRNFGKELALTAGIEAASGAAVIPMDVDLQDPPELLIEMVKHWREGYDVVLAARSDRSSDGWFKRHTARMFYKLMLRISDIEIPADVGDFRLMDRRVVEALKLMPEKTRFMKGMFAWVGFRQKTVYFKRNQRSAGEAKLRLKSLVKLAIEGIVSFTSLPLRLASLVGLIAFAFSIAYMTFIIVRTLVFGIGVPGYASMVVVVLFFSGLNMLCLGIMGEYISRIFIEVKNRPAYLVRDRMNFDAENGNDHVQ